MQVLVDCLKAARCYRQRPDYRVTKIVFLLPNLIFVLPNFVFCYQMLVTNVQIGKLVLT